MNAKATKFNLQPNSWKEMITANLKEFTLLWTFAYGQNSEKLIDPFLADFRTKLIRISEEIITQLSWSTRDIPTELISTIGSIAARLETLGRMQFFIDGSLGANKFDKVGVNLAKDVENLIKQLNSEQKVKPSENEVAISNKQYKYDVALSYAGEDREHAATLANILKHRGVKVFYDQYEKPILWGKDLYIHLSDLLSE